MAPQGQVSASGDTYLTDPGDHGGDSRGALDDALREYFNALRGNTPVAELYKRWQHHPISGDRFMDTPVLGDYRDQPEGDLLEKLRTIQWRWILDPAVRLDNSSRFADVIIGEITQLAAVVGDAWPDQTGRNAVTKITALATTFAEYKQVSHELATHLSTLVSKTSEAIDVLGKFAREDSVECVSFLLNEDTDDLHHKIMLMDECLADGEDGDDNPYTVEIARSEQPGLDISDDLDPYSYYSDVEKRRLDRFCDNYRNTVRAFRDLIRQTYQAVDDHLRTFMTATGQLGYRPFDDLDSLGHPAEPAEKPAERQPGDREPERDRDPGGNGGGPPKGEPPPNTGHEPTPNGADPSNVDTPDPAGQDDTTAGQSPIPVPGQETVEITEGGRTISVQSPDGQGHVRVTVDDGTGQPKTYDLDFGAGPATSPAGASDQPGQVLPAPAAGTGQPGNALPVPAGADGRCVIQDGPLTITAERPGGSPGTVVVTVDDGTGRPATYNLDHGDPATGHGAVSDQAAAPGAHTGQQARIEPAAAGGYLGADPSSAGGFGGTVNGGRPEPSGAVFDSAPPVRSGEAALATAPDTGEYQAARSGQPGEGSGGGMPMLAGVGATQGGEDSDRSGSAWQARGDLFDEDFGDVAVRIAGVLNADDRPGS